MSAIHLLRIVSIRATSARASRVASDDHNSGRIKIGSDGKLYYTIGDHGNNQDSHSCRLNPAQRLPTAGEVTAEDWTAYQGKTLRLSKDGSVPRGIPTLAGVRSHVWTYGHRNAQGLVVAPDGHGYSSEQGPKSDDELNVLPRREPRLAPDRRLPGRRRLRVRQLVGTGRWLRPARGRRVRDPRRRAASH